MTALSPNTLLDGVRGLLHFAGKAETAVRDSELRGCRHRKDGEAGSGRASAEGGQAGGRRHGDVSPAALAMVAEQEFQYGAEAFEAYQQKMETAVTEKTEKIAIRSKKSR